MEEREYIQEEQYSYPYHYLPTCSGGRFRQHQHWSWGYRYLGRLRIAIDLLHESMFNSLIDIGCGDGRFLKEVDILFHPERLMGIDYSEKAIDLARKMNPGLCYEHRDLLRSPLEEQFDVATLLEVIEHIPPDSLSAFMTSVAKALRPGGRLIITAPHTNVPVIDKHFQHFNSDMLKELLSGRFDELKFLPFDGVSWVLRFFLKLMGGAGNYYIVTHAGLSNLLFRYYLNHCLNVDSERRCQRIACMARKTVT